MGRTKRSEQKLTESATTSSLSNRPFSNITAATTNNAEMADSKRKKKARNKDKADSISIKCGPGGDADEIICVSKPVKTYQCSLPDSENGLVSGLKKCAISDKTNPKKKKKQEEDQELQHLLDFIEGKDSSKENSAPSVGKKPKKKKNPKKADTKDVERTECQVKVNEDQRSKTQKGNEKDSKKDNGKGKEERQKDSQKGACAPSDTSLNSSATAVVKPKKPPKKSVKPPSQDELEVMQLLQYIEGPSEKEDKHGATVESGKDSSDQNNNSERKKKSKKKKAPKEFDFDALKDNTHLEAKMIDEILKNPTCVNEYRLFNPTQVAYLFSKGHNEHWEQFPECDGRLKALERSREGMTLCDPGSKQLSLVFAEVRRARGKNITKKDLIEALKCHVFLQCAKCGYESEIVALQ